MCSSCGVSLGFSKTTDTSWLSVSRNQGPGSCPDCSCYPRTQCHTHFLPGRIRKTFPPLPQAIQPLPSLSPSPRPALSSHPVARAHTLSQPGTHHTLRAHTDPMPTHHAGPSELQGGKPPATWARPQLPDVSWSQPSRWPRQAEPTPILQPSPLSRSIC